MKRYFFLGLAFLFISGIHVCNGQIDSTFWLKRVVSIDKNSRLIKEESIRMDLRKSKDYYYDYSNSDSLSRHGIYRLFYENGLPSYEGNYEYLEFFDTCYTPSPSDPDFDTSIVKLKQGFFRVGNWYEFDSLGNITEIIRYYRGEEVYHHFPFHDTSIVATGDSFGIVISNETTLTSYSIKKSEQGLKLFVKLPMGHDTRFYLCDKSQNMLTTDLSAIQSHINSSCLLPLNYVLRGPGPFMYYCDFSNYKPGRYYLYYRNFLYGWREIEINIDET